MAKTVGREPAGGSDGHHSCELTTEDTQRHRGNPDHKGHEGSRREFWPLL